MYIICTPPPAASQPCNATASQLALQANVQMLMPRKHPILCELFTVSMPESWAHTGTKGSLNRSRSCSEAMTRLSISPMVVRRPVRTTIASTSSSAFSSFHTCPQSHVGTPLNAWSFISRVPKHTKTSTKGHVSWQGNACSQPPQQTSGHHHKAVQWLRESDSYSACQRLSSSCYACHNLTMLSAG